MFTVGRSIGYYEQRILAIMRGRKNVVELKHIHTLLGIGTHDLAQQHLANQAAARLAREGGIKALGSGLYRSLQPDAEPEPMVPESPKIVDVLAEEPPITPSVETRRPRHGWKNKKTLRVFVLEKLAATPDQEQGVSALARAAIQAKISRSDDGAKSGVNTMVRQGELERTRPGYVRLKRKPTP